jgi:periplasmic protein TonB
MSERTKSYLRYAIIAVSLLTSVSVLAYALKSLLSNDGKPRKPSAQVIAVLRPPPPPPPPKPEEKPPEPEMKKEEVKIPEPDPEPKQADDQPPPGQQLGLDADGSGAGDSFGLAANKGGRDVTTIGEGGGGGVNRAQFAFFTSQLQAQLQEALQRNEKLKSARYKAIVKVWLDTNGAIDRVEVSGGTGDGEIDETIRVAIADSPRMKSPPPTDMPQPVKLRLTSRNAG